MLFNLIFLSNFVHRLININQLTFYPFTLDKEIPSCPIVRDIISILTSALISLFVKSFGDSWIFVCFLTLHILLVFFLNVLSPQYFFFLNHINPRGFSLLRYHQPLSSLCFTLFLAQKASLFEDMAKNAINTSAILKIG